MPPDTPDRRWPDRIALVLATGLGTGYAPVAPGTFGSIPGLGLAWALSRAGGPWVMVAGVAVVTAVGLWAADRAEVLFGQTDPGRVVIDEVAGQMVALLFVPMSPALLGASFFLFRLFDVWKPWPARRLEDLPGGSGIMADDLAAGLYANLAVQGLVAFVPSLATGAP